MGTGEEKIKYFIIILLFIISIFSSHVSASISMPGSMNPELDLRLNNLSVFPQKEFTFNQSKKDVPPQINERRIFGRGQNFNDYLETDGTHTLEISTGSVNYWDGREYVPIEQNIEKTYSDYQVLKGVYKAFWDKKSSLRLEKDGYYIQYQDKAINIRGVENPQKDHELVSNINENRIRFEELYNDIDSEFIYGTDVLKHNYVIQKPAEGKKSGNKKPVIFKGILEYSEEFSLFADGEIQNGDFDTNQSILLLLKDEVFAALLPPVISDSSDNVIVGTYRVEVKGSKNWLSLEIPSEWLDNPERSYPVIVDPSISYTSAYQDTYTYELSPNNIYGYDDYLRVQSLNNYNQRSYIGFEFPNIPLSTITDVGVRLYKSGGRTSSSRTFGLCKTDYFYELYTTWNNARDCNPNYYLDTEIVRYTDYYTFSGYSLTQRVKDYWSWGNTQINFLIKDTQEDSNFAEYSYFYSKDSTTSSSRKPNLIITYEGTNNLPYKPSSPDPFHRKTGVSVNTDLRWSGGDPDGDSVNYIVYLEKDNYSPDEDVCYISSTTCDPGTLDYGSTYYWKVEAIDPDGESVISDTWRFTTESVPVPNPYPSLTVPSEVGPRENYYVEMSLGNTGDDGYGNGGYNLHFKKELSTLVSQSSGGFDVIWDGSDPYDSSMKALEWYKYTGSPSWPSGSVRYGDATLKSSLESPITLYYRGWMRDLNNNLYHSGTYSKTIAVKKQSPAVSISSVDFTDPEDEGWVKFTFTENEWGAYATTGIHINIENGDIIELGQNDFDSTSGIVRSGGRDFVEFYEQGSGTVVPRGASRYAWIKIKAPSSGTMKINYRAWVRDAGGYLYRAPEDTQYPNGISNDGSAKNIFEWPNHYIEVSLNNPPTASFSVTPTTGNLLINFAFDASSSSDQEDPASVLQVRWDWENDGTWDTSFSTTKTASHQYTKAGTHTIKLEVRDSAGATSTAYKSVMVAAALPDLSISEEDITFEKAGGG